MKREKMVRVEDLKQGMMVDLAGDSIADPEHESWCFECEYAIVANVERETEDCVRVDFENSDSLGFPYGHVVKVSV